MLRRFLNFLINKSVGSKETQLQEYKPVILVTGCSSGIGLSLARVLLKHPQYRIVITARNIDSLRLEFAESERLLLRNLDVGIEQARIDLVNEVKTLWGGVDILINNAGVSYRAVMEHMTEEDEYKQMNSNYFGPIGLIRLVLPGMRERGRGKIINVSSVSGMLAMPTMASYSASKHALEGASEALWYETRPFGVNISLVQPGFVHSQSFKRVAYTELSHPSKSWASPYTDFYHYMRPFIEKLMNYSRTSADDIANLILRVIQTQNPHLWIPATPDALIFHYLRRLLPRRLLLPFLYSCLPKSSSWSANYSKKRPKRYI